MQHKLYQPPTSSDYSLPFCCSFSILFPLLPSSPVVKMAAPTYTWWIALSFMIVSTLLTIHQIRLHLHWNTSPRLRRYIIRIICMVPIYAFTSWLGLTNPDVSLYFDFIRECYEAFVIYCFFQLLVQWLGGEERLASVKILTHHPSHRIIQAELLYTSLFHLPSPLTRSLPFLPPLFSHADIDWLVRKCKSIKCPAAAFPTGRWWSGTR